MKFHMELSAQGLNMTAETFDAHFDSIADALYSCDGISNQDLAGDSSTQIATFAMDVDAEDEIAAFTVGMGAVRTALHVSGGSTPGWEKHFAMLRQTLQNESEDSRGLVEA